MRRFFFYPTSLQAHRHRASSPQYAGRTCTKSSISNTMAIRIATTSVLITTRTNLKDFTSVGLSMNVLSDLCHVDRGRSVP
jgi:hypothetical protein